MAVRSFIVVSESALASSAFLLDDLPGTSGRLDVLARCIRAALLVSHGVRRDTRLYLVLGGGEGAPVTVRFAGEDAKFLRPDERAAAVLLQKVLARAGEATSELLVVRAGIALARGGIEVAVRDVGAARRFVLEEGAPDLRAVPTWDGDVAFLLGDHRGIPAAAREAFTGATAVGLGPVSLHTEDAIAVAGNEVDRWRAETTNPE